MPSIDHIPAKICRLYEIVEELEELFPGRHFTPDGHLVGSIGEVLAAYHYDLELLPASAVRHDARTKSGKLVQIKATQRNSIGIRAEPDHLIVLRILKHGNSEEIFNGPGRMAWQSAGKMQSNGQRSISCSRLKNLMDKIPVSAQIQKVRP